jgi:hypothetical protein
MQALLLIYAKEAAIQGMPQEKLGELVQAYTAYTETLRKDGVYLGSNRLRPVETASSVRVTGGKPNVVNGPFAETREQLGGYFLIEVPDMKTAQDYAAKCPGATVGTMEVRPVWQM